MKRHGCKEQKSVVIWEGDDYVRSSLALQWRPPSAVVVVAFLPNYKQN